MKTVILGAGGQLGRQLVNALDGEIHALPRSLADLTKPMELRQRLAQLRPDVVINASAYTDVDGAEKAPDVAYAINALGVRELATICRDLDAVLFHFSTDYVFGLDTARTTPYAEPDAPGPINAYGVSKLAGEYYAQSICPRHFIVRTCGLYGLMPSKSNNANFVEKMLDKAEQKKELRVVADQVCTPTSAADVAQATRELLQSQLYGVYHATNAGGCSWHEFAKTVFELTGKTVDLQAVPTGEYATLARRPSFSILSNARWIGRGFTPLRPWQEALAAYLAARAG